MHRSYQSILPCQNRLLQQKWDETYYSEHRRKVQAAIPVVDTKAPTTYMHLHLKLKKLQLEEERLATIERDNRILLEKMSYIMRTQGRIDNRNNYEYRSLNREKRQRELLRVTAENREILRRINMRKPEYSVQKWADEWEENQRFMDNISAFPKDWWVQEDTKDGKSREQSRQSKRKEEGRPKSKDSQKKDKEDKKDDDQKKDEEDREEQERKEKERKEDQRKEQERKDKEKKEKEEREEKEREQREKEEKEENERKEKERKEKEQTTTEESSDPDDSSTTQQKDSSEEQTDEERKKDTA